MSKQELTAEYTMAITESILSLFKDEDDGGNSHYRYDLDKIDATKFFTGMVMACAYVFNKLTDDDKNFLEFTHLCNQLIVQHMMTNLGR